MFRNSKLVEDIAMKIRPQLKIQERSDDSQIKEQVHVWGGIFRLEQFLSQNNVNK